MTGIHAVGRSLCQATNCTSPGLNAEKRSGGEERALGRVRAQAASIQQAEACAAQEHVGQRTRLLVAGGVARLGDDVGQVGGDAAA